MPVSESLLKSNHLRLKFGIIIAMHTQFIAGFTFRLCVNPTPPPNNTPCIHRCAESGAESKQNKSIHHFMPNIRFSLLQRYSFSLIT